MGGESGFRAASWCLSAAEIEIVGGEEKMKKRKPVARIADRMYVIGLVRRSWRATAMMALGGLVGAAMWRPGAALKKLRKR